MTDYAVYHFVTLSGRTGYAFTNLVPQAGEARSEAVAENVADLAEAAMLSMSKFGCDPNDMRSVSGLDFKPPHNIIWFGRGNARRCFPLTNEEAAQFWKAFVDASKRLRTAKNS